MFGFFFLLLLESYNIIIRYHAISNSDFSDTSQLISPIPTGGLFTQQNQFSNSFVFANMPSKLKLYKYFESTHSLFHIILKFFPCSFLNVQKCTLFWVPSFKRPTVRDFCFFVTTQILGYSQHTDSIQSDLGNHILGEETSPQMVLPFGLNVTRCN